MPAAALAAVVLLTICAFAPWPGWWRFGPRWNLAAAARASDGGGLIRRAEADAPTLDEAAQLNESAPLPAAETGRLETAPAPDAALGPVITTEPPATSGPSTSLPWSAWLANLLAAIFAVGGLAGVLRLVGGLLSVRACRRGSRLLNDADLQELLDVLQAELGLKRPIELRESNHLTTAATFGWSRPVVLLPATWRQWTTDQRRAVLAHELAHVAAGDYLACVLAQLGLALHFYHPLVHWLVARLRLEQELAADATAAALAGGRRSYLTTLAELALHTEERSLGWPAHTFLPTPGTFLRRIEMLRDSKPVGSRAPGRRWAVKWMAVGVLLAGAALIAGLRGGPVVSPFDNEAAAQGEAGGARGGGIDLTYVLNDAKMLLAIRPGEVLANEELRKAVGEASEAGPPILKLFSLQGLQQITLMGPPGVEPDDWISDGVVVLQFSDATTIEKVVETGALPRDLKKLPAPADAPSRFMAYHMPNEKTIVIGENDVLESFVASRRKGKPAIAAGEAWQKVHKGAIVAALDMEVIRDEFQKQGPPRGPAPQFDALAPLWQDSEYVAAGIILEGKTVHFRAVAACENAELAESVAETSQAAITLARNTLRSVREREKDIPAFALLSMQTAEGLLKTMKTERTDTLVVAQTSTTVPELKTAAASGLVDAISKARSSARREVSMNNLKQIMLAMHNWADVHGGRFPPPVVYGKDGKGKVPHSWRVELLPYLDQAALYEEYNFEESWDSEANKKVLAKIPPFFRHPLDDEKSVNAGYFVLVPEELLDATAERALPTAFAKRDGVRFADILDGTSNTLAVVEAKRDIPWTRPDDILFDPAKEVPTFGGYFKEGFHVGLCDGSVRFISGKYDPAVLKPLITPQDGNPLPVLP